MTLGRPARGARPGAEPHVPDHYLDLDLDLSDVVFLATANVVEQIPSALLDRMELVTIDGYTEDDKVAIARDYLLPRQRDRAALTADEVTVTDAALHKIAADYTREPGVRQFERFLAKALRKATTKLAADHSALVIDEPDLVGYLGRPRFTPSPRSARLCPASQRVSPSPAWAATSCSSRQAAPRATLV